MLEMDTSSEEYYDLIDVMGEWEQQLEESQPDRIKSKIERILTGIGFEITDLERDTESFRAVANANCLGETAPSKPFFNYSRRANQPP